MNARRGKRKEGVTESEKPHQTRERDTRLNKLVMLQVGKPTFRGNCAVEGISVDQNTLSRALAVRLEDVD